MQKFNLRLCLSTAAITISIFIFTAACHKSATTEDTGYATDQATTEKTFEDAQSAADMAAVTPNNSSMSFRTTGTTSSPCATVTRSVSGSDSVLTINFGSTDCLCKDGSYRRGEIIVTYTGPYSATGTVITITFNNYYQNDNQVTGTKKITNMGTNSSGQIYFDVTVYGGIILANGAGTLTASWTRVRTWITQGTPNVYQITGSGTLTRANGTTVAVNIPTATPLVFASDCRWIEAGSVVYTLPGGLTRTLNYGNTAVCDDEAQLTLPNGKTYNITLK